MPDLIRNNAYRILGLDNSASQRDIMKRYREITNRLKIGDRPRYALDLNLPDTLRTVNAVDDAVKKLQNRSSNLTEYFFWFGISDTVDEEAFEHLQHGNAVSYDRAAQIWKNRSGTGNFTELSYKRNLAILYCLYMFSKDDDTILKESILAWKEVVDANIFWRLFEKKCAMDNKTVMHEGAVNDLKKSITANISDIYYDLYVHHHNPRYVKEFYNIFGTFGQKTENHLLNPIHQSVYDTVEKLNKIEEKDGNNLKETDGINVKCDNCGIVSKRLPKSHFDYIDGSTLCMACHKSVGKEWQKKAQSLETVEGSGKKLRQIEKMVEKIELDLKQLHDLGLHNVDQSMVMRDHVAEAIRRAAVMIHNQAHMREKSLELFNVAKKISTTEHTKEQVESDLKIVTENIARDKEGALIFDFGFVHKKELIVKGTFVEYGKTKIYYKNVNSIMYHGSGLHCVFNIRSSRDSIFVKLDEASWTTLLNRVWPLVEPHLIGNLVKQIFEKDQYITIGRIRFDKTGYHISKPVRKAKSVLWNETIYIPTLIAAEAVLYKNRNNVQKRFATVSLKKPNAVVIPTLVKACFNEFHLRGGC